MFNLDWGFHFISEEHGGKKRTLFFFFFFFNKRNSIEFCDACQHVPRFSTRAKVSSTKRSLISVYIRVTIQIYLEKYVCNVTWQTFTKVCSLKMNDVCSLRFRIINELLRANQRKLCLRRLLKPKLKRTSFPRADQRVGN